jgi:hypothetical protein
LFVVSFYFISFYFVLLFLNQPIQVLDFRIVQSHTVDLWSRSLRSHTPGESIPLLSRSSCSTSTCGTQWGKEYPKFFEQKLTVKLFAPLKVGANTHQYTFYVYD